ncbi:MAG: class I SAM-dependent methyltransferase [Chloroflexota bacterium]|nr:class I SAM-dependent methyltransferase [Chloroflexota bacterium]
MRILASLARLHGRQRETASLCLRAPRLLHAVIRSTQRTFLGPYVTPQTFELQASMDSLASAEREYEDGPSFFAHFRGADAREVLAGKRVLDLGCGYGGRTVWYAEHAQPASIVGVEIAESVVERCRAFARRRGHDEIEFRHAFGESLPFEDRTFDVVVSYDVQEHVQDPARTLEEIARVLSPGGEAWMVFPSYLGARASHLDYVTQVPFLHRIFDPDTILPVINQFLTAAPERYGVAPQPPSKVAPTGRRVLPSLNGSDRAQSVAYMVRAGLVVSEVPAEPLVTKRAPVPFAGAFESMMRWMADRRRLPDLLVGHLAFRLRKPA